MPDHLDRPLPPDLDAAIQKDCSVCGGAGYVVQEWEESIPITLEMAIDAGDRSLQGEPYPIHRTEKQECPECQRVRALVAPLMQELERLRRPIRPADRYFDSCGAEAALDDALLTCLGVDSDAPDEWPCGHIVYDEYDSSFELWSVRLGWEPTPEQLVAAFQLGFSRCWLVYEDGTERHCHDGKTLGPPKPSAIERVSEHKRQVAKLQAEITELVQERERIQADFADSLADRNGDLYEQVKDLVGETRQAEIVAAEQREDDYAELLRQQDPKFTPMDKDHMQAICDHFREMAARFAVSRDELKRENRRLKAELEVMKEIMKKENS